MINRFFPAFLPTEGKKVVIFGAGNIATRRAKITSEFDLKITVVSHEISEEMKTMESEGNITYINKRLHGNDEDDDFIKDVIKDSFFVLACTNERAVNKKIGETARDMEILVSVADCKDECNFFFPGIAFNDKLTGAIAGDGSAHKEAKDAVIKLREILSRRDY